MTVPAWQATTALLLFSLAAESSALVVHSLLSASPLVVKSETAVKVLMTAEALQPRQIRCLSARWPHRRRRAAPKTLLFMTDSGASNRDKDVDQQVKVSAPAFGQEDTQQRAKDNSNTAGIRLEDAFGAGKGKHAGKKRRRHANKYSSKSKAGEIDPWERQLRNSEAKMREAEAIERAEVEELEKRRIQRRIERGLVEYPDEEDIDPYDPSTFGYIEVGHIQGAHGIKGEVKVRSSTDFAINRLCTPGIKHIKAPNRRFPRDIELIGGRWQKEEIFLLQLEGVKTRDAAAALRGHKVYVLEDEEVDLEENEYMVRDLVGGRAYRQDDESVYIGEVVGVVLGNDISPTAGLASDLLELRLPLENPGDIPKECYIPFVPALVPVVRVEEGNCTILMDLPEGLLDLAVEVEEKVAIRGFLPPGSEE
ncbi:Probable 16S rRNA-processing protein rimM [Ectocarpus siliculosus]|uniref:Probable 16S rRNA-processing protein rimM n=1 Tax=Ectocarpus siliculosus TaxID=2880 RepID=D7FMK3_ECTSI|nr:Probable 16S rRNA-processing protein rimM [Ectocarpus siliculosus]|eukprot:CBJ25900.1 Probable 16S rRNA-processing protein rimM [Ectocarpus siliculosus]